jgi:PhzF family phenazine biosynthesis protein
MRLPIHQVDAFTSEVFRGNPAAVVPLTRPLPDATLRAIAAENNLSETAYVVLPPGGAKAAGAEPLPLRWFTPTVEVDLCGHATLATAFVLLREGLVAGDSVRFHTASGPLSVQRRGELLVLDLPARSPRPVEGAAGRELLDGLAAALGRRPREVVAARDMLAIYERAEHVESLQPDFARLSAIDTFAVCATAPGGGADFVSRFFAPRKGVPEDPVTGSSHCTLTPYWAGRLGRTRLTARQVSARGGELQCELVGDRVRLGGQCVEYLRGEIEVP